MTPQLLQRITDLLDSDALSSWETDFLESLQEQVKAGRTLSSRQIDKLDEMEEAKA
jgi:hypothetical protein